jgi:hypothetical protein
MNAQELAAMLNGREYGEEITDAEEAAAKAHGLVVLFGYSDDNMEFRGAIDDEVGCCDGGEAFLTRDGLLQNECPDVDCPYFAKLLKSAAKIEAVWDTDGYSWVYRTDIPHATFEVMEGAEKFCRGIVFALEDVKA